MCQFAVLQAEAREQLLATSSTCMASKDNQMQALELALGSCKVANQQLQLEVQTATGQLANQQAQVE